METPARPRQQDLAAKSKAPPATPDPSLSISVFIADGDDQIAHWGLFNYMLSPHVRANNTADAIIHVVVRINTFSANAVRLGLAPPSAFTAAVLHLGSICSSHSDAYETEQGQREPGAEQTTSGASHALQVSVLPAGATGSVRPFQPISSAFSGTHLLSQSRSTEPLRFRLFSEGIFQTRARFLRR